MKKQSNPQLPVRNNQTVIDSHIDLLGKTVKDKVTGFKGTVSSVSFDLYGCIQAIITPDVNKDGVVRDSHWYDVSRLEVLEKEKRVMAVPEYSNGYVAQGKKGGAEKPLP